MCSCNLCGSKFHYIIATTIVTRNNYIPLMKLEISLFKIMFLTPCLDERIQGKIPLMVSHPRTKKKANQQKPRRGDGKKKKKNHKP